MSDMNWKRLEREVARKLGGRRVPVTGLGRAGADVIALTNLLNSFFECGKRLVDSEKAHQDSDVVSLFGLLGACTAKKTNRNAEYSDPSATSIP